MQFNKTLQFYFLVKLIILVVTINGASIKEDDKNETSTTKSKELDPTIYNSQNNAQKIVKKPKYIDKEDDKSKTRRDTFNKENPFSELKKQMNVKDRKPQLMSDARLEPNYTLPGGKYYEFSGNYEQDYNKNNNKLRKLFNLHNSNKELGYVLSAGIECTFERECSWKWATNLKDGFQVVSPQNYGKLDTGPMHDADNDTKGKDILFYL